MIINYKHYFLSVLLTSIWTIQLLAQTAPQPNYILTDNQSGADKTYIARDFIKLTTSGSNSFYFKAEPDKSFCAKIDAGLLFPPTDKTYQKVDGTFTTNPSQGVSVGNIPGKFSVSPTGASTYAVPIECPVGINGMQPQVSIVYNSQLPVGVLGRGFDLSCSSAITRISHSMYYDNNNHSIAFDGNDRFALDGMRLICDDNSTYNSTGTIYFTENNQTVRITSLGTLGDGPESFKIETSDGKTMEYGSTSDSRLIPSSETGAYIWYLKKVTDNNGNLITYNYITFNSETVLSSIMYAGGTIEFSYQTSPTKNNYYVNGNELKNATSLERIRVKGLNDYIRNYEFNGISQNGQVLLSEIKEYYNKNGRDLNEIGNSGEDCLSLNPIKFNWTNTASSTFDNNLLGGISLKSVPTFIDFNGDGYDDVFLVEKTGTAGNEVNTQKIFQNNGNYKTETFSEVIDNKNEILQLNTRVNCFADINGDAKADLIYKIKSINVTGEGYNYNYNLRVRGLNNEIGYCSIIHKSYIDAYQYQLDTNGDRKKEFNVIYGDFDGDGNTEIIVIQDSNDCWLVKYVNGTLTKTAITTNGVNLYDITDIPIGDFDGDGKMDFGANIDYKFKTYKIVNNAFVEIYTFNSAVKYVADINQDGTTDLITFETGAGNYDNILQGNISTLTYTIYFKEKNNTFKSVSGELLKGNVFSNYVRDNYETFTGVANQQLTTETIDLKDVRFEDTDGDGLLNIVLLYDRKFNFEKQIFHADFDNPLEDFTSVSQEIISNFLGNSELFLLSSDRTFLYPNRNLTHHSYWINTTGNIAVGSYCGNAFVMSPMDYLGTLYLADVESLYSYNKLYTANINGNGNKSFYKEGTWENYAGLNIFDFREATNYSESNRYSISSIEDAYGNKTTIDYKISEQQGTPQTIPYFTYKTGSPVVNSVKESNTSLNFSRTSSYDFTNEVFRRYKGFLGYLNTSVTDPDGITQRNTGVLNTNFGIIIPKNESSIIKNTTTDVTVVDKLNKRYWIRPDKVTEINYLNTGESNALKTTKTFNAYDSNGNPTEIKTEYGDGTGVSATETYTYIQKGAWYPNKPATYSIVKKSPNVSDVTRTKEYSYYDNGNLKTEISDKDNVDKLQLTNEFVYDSFGNPTQVSVTAKDLITGAPVVRTSIMTYPTGRFLETKTNPLGQITTYHWNAEDGSLTSEDSQSNVNDPAKKTTFYKYDSWGRLIETIYPDGVRKAQRIQWAESGNALKAKYYVYSQTSGTAPVQVWYDALGREVLKETYGLDGKKISVFTEYNSDGRVKQVSEPTFAASAEVWAQYDFVYNTDPFKRITSVKTPTGTITNTYGKTSTVTLTVSTPEGSKNTTQETTLNNAGQKISSKINGKEVTYTYYASGLPKTSTPNGGQALTMDYDILGNRKYLNDPDAGIVESKYNGFGELIEEKQKVHNATTDIITTNTFKPNGLLDYINRNDETTTYTYDTKNRVSKIEISATNKQEFTYDDFDRATNVKETVGNREFNRGTDYDFFGRVKKDIYTTGYYTQNKYDEYGNLTEVTDKAGRSIWKVIDENARGQITNINKGGKVTTYGFDPITGFPISTFASGVINYSYVFNNLGNLIERNDNNTTQKEKFIYDAQNRLTDWDIYHNITTLVKHNYINYNNTTGNIFKKSDLTDSSNNILEMGYGGENQTGAPTGTANGALIGPHALTTISKVPTIFPTADLAVTYTDFKKIATLNEGTKQYELTYGVDDQRRMSVYSVGVTRQLTRYYIGDYEEEIDKDNNVRKIHYLNGAILIQETNQPDKLYYTYSDFQGSLLALTNESGTVLEQYAYDPWGARRNPSDWTQKDTRTSFIISRGYTGHEHLDAFGIINMNGRVYDPLTAQFFSPDPYVQTPGDWLNYNRYSYCINNPFRYTDKSGNWFGLDDLIAAGIGGLVNFGVNLFQGNIHNVGQGFAAFGAGAVAGDLALYGPLGWAAGGAITGSTNAWLGGATGMNIVKGGIMGAISGLAGGAGGAWASTASQALGAIPGAIAGGIVGATTGGITGGLAGGLNNVLFGGGSFDDGFVNGFISGAISGGISGVISGGINGYKYAQKNGANPWTGYKIVGESRTYSSSGYGNPASYRQPDPNRDCAAYNRGFANNTNPQDYLQYEDPDGGASMYQLLKASGARGVRAEWSSDIDWDFVGKNMDNGASVFSTAGEHNYTIIKFTVSDKLNLFFGGTHQVLSNVSVFNSLNGSIQSGGSIWGRITWGY